MLELDLSTNIFCCYGYMKTHIFLVMRVESLIKRKENKMMKRNESGRSMVEMLGVLAIVGVLSVGGLAGYTTAMNKYRATEIMNSISLTLVEAETRGETVSYNGAYTSIPAAISTVISDVVVDPANRGIALVLPANGMPCELGKEPCDTVAKNFEKADAFRDYGLVTYKSDSSATGSDVQSPTVVDPSTGTGSLVPFRDSSASGSGSGS